MKPLRLFLSWYELDGLCFLLAMTKYYSIMYTGKNKYIWDEVHSSQAANSGLRETIFSKFDGHSWTGSLFHRIKLHKLKKRRRRRRRTLTRPERLNQFLKWIFKMMNCKLCLVCLHSSGFSRFPKWRGKPLPYSHQESYSTWTQWSTPESRRPYLGLSILEAAIVVSRG